nr:protein hos4 [Quercus suber]
MNGSTSPAPAILPQALSVNKNEASDTSSGSAANGHFSGITSVDDSPANAASGPFVPGPSADARKNARVDDEEDGPSEAETLIDSPVKKKEAARTDVPYKGDKPAKTRIGSLPVPGDEDDDTTDSHASPMRSVEMMDVEFSAFGERKCRLAEQVDVESDKENSSGSLSSPGTSPSVTSSRESSRSRALSEQPGRTQHRPASSNPRKRKHRASSVNFPNKRSSAHPPSRRLRGLHSEEVPLKGELSQSPPTQGHKRAVSMQSALTEGGTDALSRKRRSATHLPARESKSVRHGWEESDGSSETTSHGHNEYRRPQRGIGRATSTPGRPPGRELKRHVNKYGFTRLAEACEDGDLDMVKEWREKDADQLELAEFAGNKPLQIAALNGNDEVVKYLIDEGCQIDCANVDKDTPLIDAAENGHLEVVKILLESGVDPLRQNLKGQQALDVVTDETDDADGIRAVLREAIGNWNSDDAKRRREQEEEARHAGGPNKELHFMARSYENLLKLVTINDRNGVREFLDARVPVDNALIAAAARTGDEYLVNMLLAEITDKKAYQKPEKPIAAVLGSSHFDMLKLLTQLGQFNPMYRNRAGKTWPELAEERNGPNCAMEKEHLQRLYDQRAAAMGRRSSSPISKRDQAKRRFKQQESDENNEIRESTAPKRRNGRRLLSRRDMRAASGKAMSDSESDDSSSGMDSMRDVAKDVKKEAVPIMAPPKSPAQRRGSAFGRSRSSHSSSQAPENSPQSRRRSSSFHAQAEASLPAVLEEKAADVEMQDRDGMSDVGEEGNSVFVESKRQGEEEKKKKRMQDTEEEKEEEKEKESKAADAKAKQLLEEIRGAEEARKAQELREAEEDRRKQEEAEETDRIARAERKAAQELAEREAQMNETWRLLREKSLGALPAPLALALDPASNFAYKQAFAQPVPERDNVFLLKRFTPLVSIRQTPVTTSPAAAEHWILNVQIAALLGKQGIDLLVPRDSSGFERTFSHSWTILSDFSAIEHIIVRRVLATLCASTKTARRTNGSPDWSIVDKIKAIIPLYCVKMSDVQRYLDPVIRNAQITIQTLAVPASKDEPSPHTSLPSADGFFASFCRANKQCAPIQRYLDGRIEDVGTNVLGVTSYTVGHEK